MKKYLFSVAFLLVACFAVSAQQLSSQSMASGSALDAGNGTHTLSGSFGQPMIAETPTLKGGFFPGLLVFLEPNIPPVIQFTAPDTIKAGDKVTAIITDDNGVTTTKILYRPIARAYFDSVALLPGSGPNTYEKATEASWLDGMGIEYFFTATDGTGKKSRSPITGYHRSYGTTKGAFLPNTVYSIGTKQAQYRVIAIPYDFNNKGLGTQFKALGVHSKSEYRVATYAGNGQWHEYPDNFTELTQGKGYWFLTKNSSPITFESPRVPKRHRGSLFTMTLQPGWNQVGNPYLVPISWDDVRDFNPGATMNALKIFDGAYKDGDELDPFEGGFVFLQGSASKEIKIPFKGQVVEGGRKSTRPVFTTDLADEQWMLKLVLSDETTSSSLAAIGMHPEAGDEDDIFDDFYPPRFAGYGELQFAHPSHQLTYFAKDIVTRREKHAWSFTIAAEVKNLTLQWDNTAFGENDIELYLHDIGNNRVVNMRDAASVGVGSGMSYRILYGKNIHAEITPDRPVVGHPFPNPWNGTEAFVNIPFGLPPGRDHYDVQLEMLDAHGKPVKVLLQGQLGPGFYEGHWDGSDHQQQRSPAGLYFYRLKIAGGQSTTMSGKILLTR